MPGNGIIDMVIVYQVIPQVTLLLASIRVFFEQYFSENTRIYVKIQIPLPSPKVFSPCLEWDPGICSQVTLKRRLSNRIL